MAGLSFFRPGLDRNPSKPSLQTVFAALPARYSGAALNRLYSAVTASLVEVTALPLKIFQTYGRFSSVRGEIGPKMGDKTWERPFLSEKAGAPTSRASIHAGNETSEAILAIVSEKARLEPLT